MNLVRALIAHVPARPPGLLLVSPIDLLLANDTVVQPEILFLRQDRRGIVGSRAITGPPDFVVEILSPSTRRIDLVKKRGAYARHGVREYWIVDPEVRRVEVYTQDGAELALRAEVHSGELKSLEALPGFTMPVESVFAE